MSTPRRVIDYSCLPVRLPIWPGIVLWLFLDRLDASPLWFGIIGTLYGIWLIVAFTEWLATEEHKVRGFGNTPTGMPDD